MEGGDVSCTNCHTSLPSTAKFCLQCGERVAASCPSCQLRLPPSAKFCLECGTRVAATAPPAVSPATPAASTPSPDADASHTTAAVAASSAPPAADAHSTGPAGSPPSTTAPPVSSSNTDIDAPTQPPSTNSTNATTKAEAKTNRENHLASPTTATCPSDSSVLRGGGNEDDSIGPLSEAALMEVHAAQQQLVQTAATEKAWAMKRNWTDCEFQAGEEANKAQLQVFEDSLVNTLRQACSRTLESRHEAGVPVDFAPDLGHSSGGGGGSSSSTSKAQEGPDVVTRTLEPLVAKSGGLSDEIRSRVLEDPEVLGSSLDIVGAYLKNYEVDRAAAVLETVLPACRMKGGLWLFKALNHLACIRMKQARPNEALNMLQELEAEASAILTTEEDNDEAWEFWETMYRNFAWVLSSLNQEAKAIEYVQKAIDVKERVGRTASWFDLWDLGRMKAVTALKVNAKDDIKESQAVVTKALWLHKEAEPGDQVMRAKIWHTVGECAFALGHLEESAAIGSDTLAGSPNGPCKNSAALTHYRKALKCFKESHKLFKATEGARNPLTGGEAQATAWTLLKLGEEEEAKQYLLDAVEALSRQQSGWGDNGNLESNAPALTQAMQTVDRILDAHRRTGDREGLKRFFPALEALCSNVCARVWISKDREDSPIYEKLVSSCSMIMIASGTDEGTSRSQALLKKYMWQSPATPQAQLCSELLLSLKDDPSGGQVKDGPGMRAFLQAMARSQVT